MAKKTERQRLTITLDKTLSELTRRADSDSVGVCKCYTCDHRSTWQKMDAGHFQSRAKYPTRWLPINVRAQCKRCNAFRGGEQYKFAKNLDKEYGQGTAQDIEALSESGQRFTIEDLQDLAKGLTDELNNARAKDQAGGD